MVGSKEMIDAVGKIGKSAVYRINGIRTHVQVTDVKMAYGKIFYHIKTTMGDMKWTTEDTMSFLTSEKAKVVYSTAKEILKECLRPW